MGICIIIVKKPRRRYITSKNHSLNLNSFSYKNFIMHILLWIEFHFGNHNENLASRLCLRPVINYIMFSLSVDSYKWIITPLKLFKTMTDDQLLSAGLFINVSIKHIYIYIYFLHTNWPEKSDVCNSS